MDNDFELKVEQIHPAKDFMLVLPMKGEGKTKSGILLNNMGSTGATPTIGTVVRSGDESRYKAGTMVMFRRYSVDEVEVVDSTGAKKLYFIGNDDVISEIKQ